MGGTNFKVVAAIDVGSNILRLTIAQIDREGKITPLEELRKITHIGRDTFSFGKIDVETIHDTCNSLRNFTKLMEDYHVEHYRAVATSGIREALNCAYMLEQIRLRTGLEVEVINNSEERLITYKAIRDYLPEAPRIRNEGALIVDIGSGGVEITVYYHGHLQFTEYIKVGSLRLREILADLERMTLDFPGIIEEFIESRIQLIRRRIVKLHLKNFIGLGGEMTTIIRLCLGEEEAMHKKFIEKGVLSAFYDRIRTMTTEQIEKEFNFNYQRAEILLPSVLIFYTFLNLTRAHGIYTPLVSLRHGIFSDMVDQWFDTERKKDFEEDMLNSVRYIANQYGMDEQHTNNIEQMALTIFDQTVHLHSMVRRERLYLQVAAILHDVGKFVSLDEHERHSYNVIIAQNIIGFADEEYDIIANIARYHSDPNPEVFHENYMALSAPHRIIVSKLAAILKLAESLDVSHKQKIKHLNIAEQGKNLVFSVAIKDDILLEKWSFEGKTRFFEEVIGVKPVLVTRGGRI